VLATKLRGNRTHARVNLSRHRQLALQLPIRYQLALQRRAFRRWQSIVEIVKKFIGIHR